MTQDIPDVPGRMGRILSLKLIALTLVTIFAISFMIVAFMPDQTDSDNIDLKVGDYLHYSVTTNHLGNVSVGYSNTTIDSYGYRNQFSIGEDPGDLIKILNYFRLTPPLFNANLYDIGYFIEGRTINTSFGEKWVSTYANVELNSWDNSSMRWFLVITDVGIETNLIYRWTISNEETTMIVALNGTNNNGIWDSDDREDFSAVAGSYERIGIHPSPIYMFSQYESACIYGLIEITDGDLVSYNGTVQNASIFFISIDDFEIMSRTIQFECDETMSSRCVTEKNMLGVPGNYIVFMIINSARNSGEIRTNWWGYY